MRDNVETKNEHTERDRAQKIKPQRKSKAIHRCGFYRLNENLNWNSFDFLESIFSHYFIYKLYHWSAFHSWDGVVSNAVVIDGKIKHFDTVKMSVIRSEQSAMAQTQFSREKRATKTRIYQTLDIVRCTHVFMCSKIDV